MQLRQALFSSNGEDKILLTRESWDGAFIEFSGNLYSSIKYKRFSNSFGWDWTPTISDIIGVDWKVLE